MLRYSPGEWLGVVTTRGMALISPDVPADVIDRVWLSMAAEDGLAAVLGGLVGSFGTSLGSLPPFAVASFDRVTGEARVVVRGATRVTVTSTDGSATQVSGLGVTTWQESVIAAATLVEFSIGAAADVQLLLRDGVVRASGMRWTLVDGAEPDDEPEEPDDAADPAEPAFAPVAAVAGAAVAPPVVDPASATVPESEPEPEPDPVPVPVLDVEPLVADIGETLEQTGETLADSAFTTTVSGDDLGVTTGYDDLIFGETRISTVEDAAVRVVADDPAAPAPVAPPAPIPGVLISGLPPVPPPPGPAAPAVPVPAQAHRADAPGDHDGETISAEQLAALQKSLAGSALGPGNAGAPGNPGAPHGAPSAPTRSAPVLVTSFGERVVLDRGAVIGRRPRAVRATGAVPHLVTVESAEHDISRSHVELRVELRAGGADVVAIDLDTTNGTRLLRLGADPVRLHPGEPTLLVPGDRLDIGDAVVLSFEGLG